MSDMTTSGNHTVTQDLTVDDDLVVTGDAAVTGNTTLTGTLGVTGATTLTGGITGGLALTLGSDATGDMLYKSSATALARLAKGTAGQYLQQNTGLTAPEWDTITDKWSFRIPAASGKDTDAGNGGLAGCDQTLDVTQTQYTATFVKVEDSSAAAFANIETASTGAFTQYAALPSTTTDNDALYIGRTIPFCQVRLDVSATVQTYTGDATVWEYWNGTIWTALTTFDYTDATAQDGKRSFGRDGSLHFTPPADWASSTVDGVAAYWIRMRAGTAANISQVAIFADSASKANVYYSAPTDGFIVPHAGTVTRVCIRDEAGTVHTAADIKFVLMNFTTGVHSGELTFAQDKRNDSFASLTLAVAAGDVLGVLVRVEDGTNEMGPVTLELGVTLV